MHHLLCKLVHPYSFTNTCASPSDIVQLWKAIVPGTRLALINPMRTGLTAVYPKAHCAPVPQLGYVMLARHVICVQATAPQLAGTAARARDEAGQLANCS